MNGCPFFTVGPNLPCGGLGTRWKLKVGVRHDLAGKLPMTENRANHCPWIMKDFSVF